MLRRFASLAMLLSLVSCGGDLSENPPSIQELLCTADHSTQAKIINGRSCKQNRGIVQIETLDEESNVKICSGVLLDERHGISAAHCFDQFTFSARVRLTDKYVAIAEALPHPLFEDSEAVPPHDLVIFTLEQSTPLDPLPLFIGPAPNPGDVLTILGFGRSRVEDRNDTTVGDLRIGEMIISETDNDFIRATPAESGNTTCLGDSGGPALIEVNGEPALLGLASAGTRSDCGPGDIAIFTNLLSRENVEFLRQNVPHLKVIP